MQTDLWWQSVYGQHVLRKTTIDPPALNHYKQLIKRPSSERPFETSEIGKRNKNSLHTTLGQQIELAADSIVADDITRSLMGTTPGHSHLQITASQFAHEAMLLSGQKSAQKSSGVFQNRAQSHVRGTFNPIEVLSNHSLLQSNMSSSTMIDSTRPMKQKRSLNFITKKREAERIDEENALFM